jgi:predicted phage terminase large subunit-like protein
VNARRLLVALALAVVALTAAESNRAAASFARANLLAYAIGQWPGYQPAAHHRLLASQLEAVERGEVHRLIVAMPPRHGKSMLASEFFPAWYLGRNPSRSVIASTYSQELASDFGRKVRNLTDTQLHRAAFPLCRMSEDSKAVHRFSTDAGGAYYAVGRGGSITGRGGNLFLIDDPLKDRAEAESDTTRESTKAWYRSVARTRLAPGGAIVIVQTRWHDDDLAGYVTREHAHEGWTVLNLPALAEADDALGRAEGEPLWPEAYPVADLHSIRCALGTYDWAALYQQHPTPAEGGIFKLSWFASNRYDVPLAKYRRIVQSWDTGQKAADRNDPSVCTTWGESETTFDLLDVFRARMEYPELRRTAESLALLHQPIAVLVEDKSSGQSLVQDLKASTKLPVIPREPEGDKVIRAMSVSPLCEAGRVRLPRAAAWLPEFEAELYRFPNAVHDDQVDSMSQALTYMHRGKVSGAEAGLLFLQRQAEQLRAEREKGSA